MVFHGAETSLRVTQPPRLLQLLGCREGASRHRFIPLSQFRTLATNSTSYRQRPEPNIRMVACNAVWRTNQADHCRRDTFYTGIEAHWVSMFTYLHRQLHQLEQGVLCLHIPHLGGEEGLRSHAHQDRHCGAFDRLPNLEHNGLRHW
jgi:hypothetical protein